MNNNFPTGRAKDKQQLERLIALINHPGWKDLLEVSERTKAAAHSKSRTPNDVQKSSVYDWAYNNGCQDQLDVLLKLPKFLQLQTAEVKEDD